MPVDNAHTSSGPHRLPVIAISMGDPLGIGPEIVAKALGDARVRGLARYRIHGSVQAMAAAARAAGIEPFWRIGACGGGKAEVLLLDDAPLQVWDAAPGARGPTKQGGEASLRWVEGAIRDAHRAADDPERADAIVTAPISKTSWNLAGETRWPGHTELLAERFGAKRSGMLFVGPHLRVMLTTIHVPLMRVGELLTVERVLEAIELAEEGCGKGLLGGAAHLAAPAACLGSALLADQQPTRPPGEDARTWAGRPMPRRPRIAVCGLNPHAGEGGILGSEDVVVIAPAVARAREKGIDAVGPLPGDTVFNAAAAPPVGKGLYDCVVAMYHDQGLIPVKLVDGPRAVNVTAGLPTVRTSPAHGTAFDIAGRNAASAESMVAAIELAVRMIPAGR